MAPPNRPLVWNVSMHDAQSRKVFDHSGMDHLPGGPGSQPIVSLFSIDAPTELAAPLPLGDYTLDVQLVDAFDSAPVALASGGSNTWSIGPIAVAPPARRRAARRWATSRL